MGAGKGRDWNGLDILSGTILSKISLSQRNSENPVTACQEMFYQTPEDCRFGNFLLCRQLLQTSFLLRGKDKTHPQQFLWPGLELWASGIPDNSLCDFHTAEVGQVVAADNPHESGKRQTFVFSKGLKGGILVIEKGRGNLPWDVGGLRDLWSSRALNVWFLCFCSGHNLYSSMVGSPEKRNTTYSLGARS